LPVALRSKRWIDAYLIPLLPASKIHYFGDPAKLARFRELSRDALAAMRRAFLDVEELVRGILYRGPLRDSEQILGYQS
jgi:hypothetical protein